MHQLYMNADGWLVASPHRYAGESLGRQRRGQVPGPYKLIRHDKVISPAIRTSVLVMLEPDGSVTGAATGRWELRHDNDFTVALDGVTYGGVFTTAVGRRQRRLGPRFSAISADGVAAWGSQHRRVANAAAEGPLRPRAPLYGETFSLAMPRPLGAPQAAYSYSVVSGPAGLTVDRATGVVTLAAGACRTWASRTR